jgi:hypothetical protein
LRPEIEMTEAAPEADLPDYERAPDVWGSAPVAAFSPISQL